MILMIYCFLTPYASLTPYWRYVSWLSCTVNFESPYMWLT